MAELVLWSPARGVWLDCQPRETTWLDRNLLSAGADDTLHRAPRCPGLRDTGRGWELFSHDMSHEVYLSPGEADSPMDYRAVRAAARHVLPAARATYEQDFVQLESVVRLETGVWWISVGRWAVQMHVNAAPEEDSRPPEAERESCTRFEPDQAASADLRGQRPPRPDSVAGVRAYFRRKNKSRTTMAYYYQQFIRGAVAPQELPMMTVAVALDLNGEGTVSDYKKELQRLIWGEQGHQRELAEFLLAHGLLTRADLEAAETIARTNAGNGRSEAARQRFRYKPQR